jgi:hypothetical protein
MELYLIKSTIALSIFYLFYWIFFRNSAYYTLNRLYLLLALLQAIILPFFQFSFHQESFGAIVSSVLTPVVFTTSQIGSQVH